MAHEEARSLGSARLTAGHLLLAVLQGANGATLELIQARTARDALAEQLRARMGRAA